MNSFLYNVGFHRTGKPRQWLSFLLFRKDSTARPIFRRIVHKKNGRVRPRYAHWVKSTRTDSEADLQTPEMRLLRQEELFLQTLEPLERAVANWRGRKDPAGMLDAASLAALIAPAQAAQPSLVIAVGHDNYRKEQGGVQLCIQREEAMAAAKGFDYLQIHPWHPTPRLAHADEEPDTIVGLMLNGKAIGACRTSELIRATAELSKADLGKAGRSKVHLVIHHMLGHLPEQMAELAQATGSGRCVLWLHDFFSICPSYTLQRNGLHFCHAPPVRSNACNLCVYGKERVSHQARMAAFFAAVQVDVASPSRVTAEMWRAKSGLVPATITEIPHIVLEPVARTTPFPEPTDDSITIGYLGAQAQHKGWPVFTQLMHGGAGAHKLRFVVLSGKRPLLGEDQWVSVNVTAESPNAMAEAVAAANLDIVLHWPAWPETFSFTTFEALAGSAYILTNPWSGNVADAVRTTGRGAVLQNEADLLDFLRSDRLTELVGQRRRQSRSLQLLPRHSDLSYLLLGKG